MTVMSLSASLLQKISEAMYCLCHITRNQHLLHKFEKWCKFWSCVKAKSHKTRLHKTRHAGTQFFDRIVSVILMWYHFPLFHELLLSLTTVVSVWIFVLVAMNTIISLYQPRTFISLFLALWLFSVSEDIFKVPYGNNFWCQFLNTGWFVEHNSLHKNDLCKCYVPQLELLQKYCGKLLKNLNIHICHKWT
jgi:hypothetical protein